MSISCTIHSCSWLDSCCITKKKTFISFHDDQSADHRPSYNNNNIHSDWNHRTAWMAIMMLTTIMIMSWNCSGGGNRNALTRRTRTALASTRWSTSLMTGMVGVVSAFRTSPRTMGHYENRYYYYTHQQQQHQEQPPHKLNHGLFRSNSFHSTTTTTLWAKRQGTLGTMAGSQNGSTAVFPTPTIGHRSLSTEAISIDECDNEHGGSGSGETSGAKTTDSVDSLPLLWHPEQFGPIQMPKALSPSSISEFQKCPQSFFFQYICGIRQPPNTALACGSVCHTALEQVYSLDPDHRTLEVLQNLFRREWAQLRNSDPYRTLFAHDREAEIQWGKKALQLLANYQQMEDPRLVPRPNPIQRETWIQAHLTVDSTEGVTGYTSAAVRTGDHRPDDRSRTSSSSSSPSNNNNNNNNNNNTGETFLVRGIIDRLDLVATPDPHEPVCLRLIDYKTGAAPAMKYSHAVNERIQAEAFQQLILYALLWRERRQGNPSNTNTTSTTTIGDGGALGDQNAIDAEEPLSASSSSSSNSMPLRYLRLFHLTSAAPPSHPAKLLDLDLGATPLERDRLLQRMHATVSNVWKEIKILVNAQDPLAWKGCTRSFCYCHQCRSRFVPGTVWEPDTPVSTSSSTSTIGTTVSVPLLWQTPSSTTSATNTKNDNNGDEVDAGPLKADGVVDTNNPTVSLTVDSIRDSNNTITASGSTSVTMTNATNTTLIEPDTPPRDGVKSTTTTATNSTTTTKIRYTRKRDPHVENDDNNDVSIPRMFTTRAQSTHKPKKTKDDDDDDDNNHDHHEHLNVTDESMTIIRTKTGTIISTRRQAKLD